MVYGALPPDARQQQAALFNAPRSGYGVLAASDAVGMGLNLAIRRVVFTSVRKFDGTQERLLTPSEVKQVGRHRQPCTRCHGPAEHRPSCDWMQISCASSGTGATCSSLG